MKERLGQKDPRSIIMSLFVISTLLVLPLVFKTDYTDLFDAKYAYYYISALSAIGIFLLFQLYLFMKGNRSFQALGRWEIALLVFVAVCIVSTLQSKFVYEAFWGNEGRYNGLFLMLLYCITAYLAGRYLNMKQWYFDLFLIAGMLVIVVGLGDYLDLDLLNFKHNMTKGKPGYDNFASTVGNINFYTSYVSLVLGGSAGVFCAEQNKRRAVFYYIGYVLAVLGLLTGNSDSGYLAVAAIVALLPLYCFKYRVAARRYVLLMATLVSLVQLVGRLNEIWSERVIVIDSLLSQIAGTGTLVLAVILWAIVLFLYFGKRGGEQGEVISKVWRYVWTGILLCAAVCLLSVLYDVNIAGNAERYGPLAGYLYFDNAWGTYRGYVWRVAWEYYIAFSPRQKLLGYGLETFPILTIYNNKWEMTYKYSYYDSVHNEYLQHLLGIGLIGLAAYLNLLTTAIMTLIKNLKRIPYLFGIIIGLIAYFAQAVVNISTVNVAAVMWILMAIGLAACRKTDDNKMSNEGSADGKENN